MKIERTPIEGLLVLEPRVFEDERGWFMESFNQTAFDEALGERVKFVQDNHSFSKNGVLRGLHYQLPPHSQGKLVRVVQGVAWDVAVDIRKSSSTFGKWFGIELSAENRKQFWIPPGFAHGFLALSDITQFLYKATAYYHKESERSIRWSDQKLDIHWPLNGMQPLLGTRDQHAPFFDSVVELSNDIILAT
jgi:dTDP-4-dehydrorhamnose 3,5-epimerase